MISNANTEELANESLEEGSRTAGNENTTLGEVKNAGPACKRCRVKKIKCDRKTPSCTTCARSKCSCEFDLLPKRKRKSPTGAKHLTTIEERIKQLESIIKEAGILNDDRGGKRHEAHNGSRSEPSSVQPDGLSNTFPTPDHFGNVGISSTECPSSETSLKNQDDACRSTDNLNIDCSHSDSTNSTGFLSQQKTPDSLGLVHSLITNPFLGNDQCVSHIGQLPVPLAELFKPRGVPCFLNNGDPVPTLWSPTGMQWLSQKTQESTVQQLIKEVAISVEDKSKRETYYPASISFGSRQHSFYPFPSYREALVLVELFSDHFNGSSPMFHRPTLMQHVHNHYEGKTSSNAAWFACFSIVLAIGYHINAMLGGGNELVPADKTSNQYLKNALKVIPDLMVQPPNLMSVQAILGIAMVSQVTGNFESAFSLIGTAMRLLNQLGFRESNAREILPQSIEEQQAWRVFGLTYMVEKDLTLQNDFPSIRDSIDCNFMIPARPKSEDLEILLVSGETNAVKIDFFRVRLRLACIQAKVQRQICLQSSHQRVYTDVLIEVEELHFDLERWKNTIPLLLRPPQLIAGAPSSSLFHIAMIQLQYYSTTIRVHHLAIECGYEITKQPHELRENWMSGPGPAKIHASHEAALAAARQIFVVLNQMPVAPGGNALNWLNLRMSLSAFSTIFANILTNPGATTVHSDLELLRAQVEFLTIFERVKNSLTAHPSILQVCKKQEEMARQAVQQATNSISYEGLMDLLPYMPNDLANEAPFNFPPTFFDTPSFGYAPLSEDINAVPVDSSQFNSKHFSVFTPTLHSTSSF